VKRKTTRIIAIFILVLFVLSSLMTGLIALLS